MNPVCSLFIKYILHVHKSPISSININISFWTDGYLSKGKNGRKTDFKGSLQCQNSPTGHSKTELTHLVWPAHRQGVVVICLLGVMIRAHFVDIESHVVPRFVAHCPA